MDCFRQDKKLIIISIFVICIYLIRIVNLDSDVPVYNLSNYMQLDENYYVYDGVLLARPELANALGELDKSGIKSWPTSDCWTANVLAILTFKVFGNNYYGLRMPSVIAGLITLLLVLHIILRDRRKKAGLTIFIPLVFYVLSFGFLLSTRIMEPSVFRAMWTVIFFWISGRVDLIKNRYLKAIIYGIAGGFCIALSYPSNVFILAAIGLKYFIGWLCEKETKVSTCFKETFAVLIGLASSILMVEPIYYLVHKRHYVSNFFLDVTYQSDALINFSISALKDNVCEYIKANTTIYYPAVFVIFTISTVWCLYKGIKDKDQSRLLTALLVSTHFTYCFLVADFTTRKAAVIFPMLILGLYYMIQDWDELIRFVSENKLKTIYKIAFSLETLLLMYFSYRKVAEIKGAVANSGIHVILVLMEAQLIGLLGLIWWKQIRGFSAICVLTILICLVPSVILDEHVIFELNKTEKQTMVQIGSIVGNNPVMGGWAQAFSLYNEIIPLTSKYDVNLGENGTRKFQYYSDMEEVQYYLGDDDWEFLESLSNGRDYKWVMIKQFETDFMIDNVNNKHDNVYLFEKIY